MSTAFHFRKGGKPMSSKGGWGRGGQGHNAKKTNFSLRGILRFYLWSTFFQPVKIVLKFHTVYCLISWIFFWSWRARRCSKQPWKETDRRQTARACTWVQRGARGKRRCFEQAVDSHGFQLNGNGNAAFYDLSVPFHDHCPDKFKNFSFIVFPLLRSELQFHALFLPAMFQRQFPRWPDTLCFMKWKLSCITSGQSITGRKLKKKTLEGEEK